MYLERKRGKNTEKGENRGREREREGERERECMRQDDEALGYYLFASTQ